MNPTRTRIVSVSVLLFAALLLTTVVIADVAAQAEADPTASYVTVTVADNKTDPENPAYDFDISWSDTEHCSDRYDITLTGWHQQPILAITVAQDATSATGTVQASAFEDEYGLGYFLRVTCIPNGDSQETIRRVSDVRIYEDMRLPAVGTYSSEPALLAVSSDVGHLSPDFHRNRESHALVGVPEGDTRITLTTTTTPEYSVLVVPDTANWIRGCGTGTRECPV